jgi:hypothetical protein
LAIVSAGIPNAFKFLAFSSLFCKIPSALPSALPSAHPSIFPTFQPSALPSFHPSRLAVSQTSRAAWTLTKAIADNEQESRKEWLLDRCWFRGANDRKITNFKFWQDGSYIETIDSYEFYRQKADYIHMNPVRQEIVERPEEYLYSSARDYAGEKGLLDVVVLL